MSTDKQNTNSILKKFTKNKPKQPSTKQTKTQAKHFGWDGYMLDFEYGGISKERLESISSPPSRQKISVRNLKSLNNFQEKSQDWDEDAWDADSQEEEQSPTFAEKYNILGTMKRLNKQQKIQSEIKKLNSQEINSNNEKSEQFLV